MRLDGWARIPVRAGQTVTGALLCAGVLATSRSLKYRRPRGPFCLRGDCGSCLVRVDGRPNLRACMLDARPGMEIESQNRRPQGEWDVVDWIDGVAGPVLDHHHLALRPRWANRWMQTVARRLAGLGRLPSATPTLAEPIHRDVDVLVIGGGVAGRAVEEALSSTSATVHCVDRRAQDIAVFGIYPDERCIAAGTDGRGPAEYVHTFGASHVVFATGSKDSTSLIPGNDRPGVVAARGLCELLERERLELATDTVVIGDDACAPSLAHRLGRPWFSTTKVQSIAGASAVEAVILDDDTRVPARLVALAEPPCAASDLARQAGVGIRWDDHAGFIVERDHEGRCRGRGPWQLWACGAVCGVAGDTAARDDGARVGRAIAARFAAMETTVR